MENKNKSTIIKDALTLFAITLVSGLALGFVYELTKPVIAANELAAKTEAYQAVFTEAENFAETDELKASVADSVNILANSGTEGTAIEEAYQAVDASGNAIGYVMSVTSSKGFGGEIKVSLGITLEGEVTGIEFLTLNETAGLGSKAADESYKNQYIGKVVDNFAVVKGESSAENEIAAISGATITSQAVTNIVNAAVYFTKTVGGN